MRRLKNEKPLVSLLRRPRFSVAFNFTQGQTKSRFITAMEMSTSQQNPANSLAGKTNPWSTPGLAAFDFRSKPRVKFLSPSKKKKKQNGQTGRGDKNTNE